ncbi:unnamed protein product [Moneuplotes crassus]|uniref:Arrestin-like N-terminal domain-containing protein n=1 Tax=Euplotes crassus TaxID=5936 RepID=A0AAD1UP74_EUPCR|nr:unnamed protein product [Moneuplotes crassus]
MGNNCATAETEFGSIFVRLDQKAPYSGQILNGTVYLELKQNYPAQSVSVGLEGCEAFDWGKGKGGGTNLNFTLKKELVNKATVLYTFSEAGALAGQYSFPFQFQVPSDLPSSFYSLGIKPKKALVKYVFRGILRSSEKTVKDLTFERVLPINEVSQVSLSDIHLSTSDSITSWFGMKKHGVASLSIKISNDCFTTKEMIRIKTSIDNSQCDLPVKKIFVALMQLTGRRKYNGAFESLTDTTDSLVLPIWLNNYEGVGAFESTEGFTRDIEINLKYVTGTLLKKNFDAISDYSDKEIMLVKDLQASSSGSYTTISYHITIKLCYGIASRRSTKIRIPIFLKNPESETPDQIHIPADFNPLELQTASPIIPAPIPSPHLL